MGLFNVPQFIDIEDKIVGPLTAKQLGWIAAAGVILLLCWAFLDLTAFIISAVIVGPIFGGLAFYRPNGQPLIFYIFSIFTFFLRPKIYIWKRIPDKIVTKFVPTKKTLTEKNAKMNIASKKETSNQSIEDISNLLDRK